MLGASFSEDLFRKENLRVKKSRRERREVRRNHGLIRAKDKPGGVKRGDWELSVSRAELQQLQEEDETLAE